MRPITISLVTPTLNQAEFIKRSIDSVLDQRGNFHLEYRVLDGGSTDGTLDILRSYGDQLEWKSSADKGQVDAINRGLGEASGDIVGWLNSDDMLLPGALAKVAETFQTNSDCLWCHGNCIVIDRNDQEIRRWISAYKRFYAKRYSRDALMIRNFISQMTVFWRRDLIDEVGPLDPELSLAFDYEYWLRLSLLADPCYIPQKLAAFRWYETSKSGSTFSRQFQEDERIARAHGLKNRFSKRVSNHLIVQTYRLMGLGRRLGKRFATKRSP